MNIDVSLSTVSINRAIRQIETYRRSIPGKLERLERRLADYGIQAIQKDLVYTQGDLTQNVSGYIKFRKDFKQNKYSCKAIIMEYDAQKIIAEWKSGEDFIKTAEVSPSQMLEFGSGRYADNEHRGSFPGQKHANNPDGWYWVDLNDEKHHSFGTIQTHPMHNMVWEMYSQIETIAREVFKE